jgi:hypothetical protein
VKKAGSASNRLTTNFILIALQGKKAIFEVLEKELVDKDNPWLKMAGKYKNEPQFDEMLAYIEIDRQEI